MQNKPDYSQTRSFNLGIAQEISVEAALIYDDLKYAQETFGAGKWFYRSYEQLMNRLPYSERTLRRHIDKLVEHGWIMKKIKKVNEKPICHYMVTTTLDAVKLTESLDTVNLTETLLYNNTITSPPAKAGELIKEKFSSKKNEEELLSLVNNITNRTFRTLPRGAVKLLKTFSLEEIRLSLMKLANDPWHKERLKELSSDYLLRTSTIDRFLDDSSVSAATAQEKQRRIEEEEEELKRFRDGVK